MGREEEGNEGRNVAGRGEDTKRDRGKREETYRILLI
jgi:hypothetical protein